jgi:hypothetical protein
MGKFRPEAVTAVLIKAATAASVTADTFFVCKWIVEMAAVKSCYCWVKVITHKIKSTPKSHYTNSK